MSSVITLGKANSALAPKRRGVPYGFVAPALILVTAGLAIPAIYGAWNSLFSNQIGNIPAEFVGLDNYTALFGDPAFWNSLLRSGVFVFGAIIVTQAVALSFALTLHRLTGKARVLRGIVLVPYLVSGVAAAEFFRVSFHSSLGFANLILQAFGLAPMQWLGHATNAMVVLILAMAWLVAPLAMLIIMAGLHTVDPSYVEAAKVDGASAWQTFWHITFFLISRQFVLSLLWISFNAFNAFGLIIALTGGGPGRATETLSLFMYDLGFKRLDVAAGLAVMVILLAINLILSIVYLRFMNVDSGDT